MLVFQRNADLQAWVAQEKKDGKNIGFAPTMGALHEGHLDLVRAADARGDRAVVSIFVNPTQFNDPKDLEKYPRTPGRDLHLLLGTACAAVYMPTVEEVYPPGRDLSVKIDFGTLDKTMEGAFRPGHFAGMATVVNRLLDVVKPDRLYMGQKDYQQLSIVRDMIRQLDLPVALVMVPTRREPDGLAMSSRNVRLTHDMRAAAPAIHRTLLGARERFPDMPAAQVQEWAFSALRQAGLAPEYFELVDGFSLLPVQLFADSNFVVACTAVKAGEVRLIDNEVVKNSSYE
ncbi:MAG: pantoate--beta-alanine ligase [Saprospiraceae bacterium]|nr:pantoate--beta-alanine ligase [Saprospiraceae bacterium]